MWDSCGPPAGHKHPQRFSVAPRRPRNHRRLHISQGWGRGQLEGGGVADSIRRPTPTHDITCLLIISHTVNVKMCEKYVHLSIWERHSRPTVSFFFFFEATVVVRNIVKKKKGERKTIKPIRAAFLGVTISTAAPLTTYQRLCKGNNPHQAAVPASLWSCAWI